MTNFCQYETVDITEKALDTNPKRQNLMNIDIENDGVGPRAISRPHVSLLACYIPVSLPAIAAFPLVFLPLYIRFKTLRYEIDDDAVTMFWGCCFIKRFVLQIGEFRLSIECCHRLKKNGAVCYLNR